MKIIDTHAHPSMIIELKKNKENITLTHDNIIQESINSFVEKIICISTNINDSKENILLSSIYKEYYCAIGIHPCDVSKNSPTEDCNYIESLLKIKKKNSKIVGIGETGIDCYHDTTNLDNQIISFEKHIEISKIYNLPLIIHSRAATKITYDIIKTSNLKIPFVIHCFQDEKEWAKKWIDLGGVLGASGMITYPKNIYLKEAFLSVGIDHILLETDAPFLPPQKFRGTINTPSLIYHTGIELSSIIGITKETVFKKTYDNAISLFSIGS